MILNDSQISADLRLNSHSILIIIRQVVGMVRVFFLHFVSEHASSSSSRFHRVSHTRVDRVTFSSNVVLFRIRTIRSSELNLGLGQAGGNSEFLC